MEGEYPFSKEEFVIWVAHSTFTSLGDFKSQDGHGYDHKVVASECAFALFMSSGRLKSIHYNLTYCTKGVKVPTNGLNLCMRMGCKLLQSSNIWLRAWMLSASGEVVKYPEFSLVVSCLTNMSDVISFLSGFYGITVFAGHLFFFTTAWLASVGAFIQMLSSFFLACFMARSSSKNQGKGQALTQRRCLGVMELTAQVTVE